MEKGTSISIAVSNRENMTRHGEGLKASITTTQLGRRHLIWPWQEHSTDTKSPVIKVITDLFPKFMSFSVNMHAARGLLVKNHPSGGKQIRFLAGQISTGDIKLIQYPTYFKIYSRCISCGMPPVIRKILVYRLWIIHHLNANNNPSVGMVSSDSKQSAKGYWAAVILNLEQLCRARQEWWQCQKIS